MTKNPGENQKGGDAVSVLAGRTLDFPPLLFLHKRFQKAFGHALHARVAMRAVPSPGRGIELQGAVFRGTVTALADVAKQNARRRSCRQSSPRNARNPTGDPAADGCSFRRNLDCRIPVIPGAKEPSRHVRARCNGRSSRSPAEGALREAMRRQLVFLSAEKKDRPRAKPRLNKKF